MTLQYLPNDHIHDNPYQTRVVAPLSVTDLVESFKERGMLTVPTARPHPTTPGHVQLIEGHRRRCAWFTAWPNDPMPVEVKDDVSDRDMFELNVIENSQRAELNDMEKARQMQAYIQTFNASQAAAGKLFNLKTQGAVSNLLRLLDLPGEIQTRVVTGHLSQRTARALIIPARIDKDFAITLVEKEIADATKHAAKDKEEVDWVVVGKSIESEIMQWVYRKGKALQNAPWDLKAKPLIALDGESKPRPCDGCPMKMKPQYGGEMCMAQKCFTAKQKWYADSQLAAASKKSGIPVLAANETAWTVWNGEWPREPMEKIVKSKLPHLRLAIYTANDYQGDAREKTLGSAWAHLVSIDREWVDKQKVAAAKSNHSPSGYDPAKEQAKREKAKAVEQQCLQLVDVVLPSFAAIWPTMPAAFEDQLLDVFMESFSFGDLSEKKLMALPASQRRAEMMRALLNERCVENSWNNPSTKKTEQKIAELAKAFKVKLPKHWNQLAPTAPATNGKAKKGAKK